MRIALITKLGSAETGLGRYSTELARGLGALGHDVTIVHPIIPIPAWLSRQLRRWLGFDVDAFLQNYPIWVRYPSADVYHFTSQNLATLLLFRRPRSGRIVVTVHDVIPWTVRRDPELRVYRHKLDELFDFLALRCVKRADAVLAVSEYTARSFADAVH